MPSTSSKSNLALFLKKLYNNIKITIKDNK